MECEACGAPLSDKAAFCPACGHLTARGAPLGERIGSALANGASGIARLLSQLSSYARQPENRTQVIGVAILCAVLLIAFTSNPISEGIGSSNEGEPEGPRMTAAGQPDFASYKDVFINLEASYRVTGPANVRNYPTSQGTQVMYSFAGGEIVRAQQVMAFDPSSTWLKLADGGYVWGRNLTSAERRAVSTSATFPNFLHGAWSSMDTCRGNTVNAQLWITDTDITFDGGLHGMLQSVSKDANGRSIYHMLMTMNGRQWRGEYQLDPTANGISLLIDDLSDSISPDFAYHNPESGCARVFFLNE